MSSIPSLTAYCLPWHLSKSDAFFDLLVEPLKKYAAIQFEGWNGIDPLPDPPNDGMPVIFCQWLPPRSWLEHRADRLIWIPMWDNIRTTSQRWWDQLPKSLRVVAFSDAVYQRAQAAGLNTLRMTYHKNPADFSPVMHENGRIMFYWNRTGLIGPDMLEKLCTALRIDTLLFRPQIDPSIDSRVYYELGERLGSTRVETIPVYSDRAAYLAAIQAANIFVAPRLWEGVGMSFLEAMARGCAVIASSTPTMSEYIISGQNGWLLPAPKPPSHLYHALTWRFYARGWLKPRFRFALRSESQDWDAIAALDPQTLGQNARIQATAAYQTWLSEISAMAAFFQLA